MVTLFRLGVGLAILVLLTTCANPGTLSPSPEEGAVVTFRVAGKVTDR